MATLAENAAAVKAAQEAIDEAIVDKGGTTAGGLTNAAAAIAALPSGARHGEWQPPSDWPDIRKILEDNWPEDTDYDAACIYLLCGAYVSSATFGGTVTYIVNSDGVINTTSNNNNFVRDNQDGLRWVAKYGYHDQITIVNGGTKTGALWAHFVNVDFASEGQTNALSYVSQIQAYTGTVNVNYSGNFSFQSNSCLKCCFEMRVKDGCLIRPYLGSSKMILSLDGVIDFSKCNDISSCFGINDLVRLPDVVDLSNCTNCNDAFNGCYSLLRFPTHLKANGDYGLNIKFNSTSVAYLVDRNSFAEFDIGGALVGGLAYNINDLTGSASPPTLTLSSTFKNRFSADEQTAIVNKFVSSGWNLSW